MKKSTSDRNVAAINSLGPHDLYNAQKLFRENVKSDRCVMTLTNLGVFYGEHNIVDKNLCERNGSYLALRYLNAAMNGDRTGKAAFAAGNVHFKRKEYREAAVCFDRSFCLEKRFASAFNVGACLMKKKSFEAALYRFLSAEVLVGNDGERTDALIALAFAKTYCGEADALEAAGKVYDLDDDGLIYEKFVLAYMTCDIERTSEYAAPFIKGYSLSRTERAMAFDALAALGRSDEALEFCRLETESMAEIGDAGEIARTERMMCDNAYRKAVISEYYPPIELQKTCCYIDCPIHK